SSLASAKSPSTVASVAFCIASAWCEPFQRSASPVWQSAQIWPPTKLAGSSALAYAQAQAEASRNRMTVAARRTKAVIPRTNLRQRDAGNLLPRIKQLEQGWRRCHGRPGLG